MNRQREIAQTIADRIKGAVQLCDELMQGCRLDVLVEDKLSGSFAIENNLGRNGICVIVGITGFTRKPNTAHILFGTLNIDVSVYENPDMSRETENSPTAQMVAEFLMQTLHWHKADGWLSPLRLQGISRADEYPFVVERMTFSLDVQF